MQAEARPASPRFERAAVLRACLRPPVLQVLAVTPVQPASPGARMLSVMLVPRDSRAAQTPVSRVLRRPALRAGPLQRVVPETLVQEHSPWATTPQVWREPHPV